MLEESTFAENILSAFEDADFLKFLDKDDRINLLADKQHFTYKKGDEIIQEGATPKGIYCIISGTSKLYKIGFNGKEQILRFAKDGDVIGYRSILCNEVFGASATAMGDMEVVFIPEKHFLNVLEVNSKLCFEFLKRVSKELGEASRTITILAQKTVRERLAEILILLERKLGTDTQGFINISLTREEVANLIGTATESAIRLISEFKSDKLIEVDGRRIRLLDHQKLTKLGHINKV